jgi:hypothetical protein
MLGVVGKLHNFVNAICASHKRRELFKAIQGKVNNELFYSFDPLELRQAGDFRWHSVYLMLLRCFELKDTIQRFIRRLRSDNSIVSDNLDYSPLTDSLTDDEWGDVKEFVDFLKAPYEMTKRLEGNNSCSGFGSIWQTLPNLQALWTHYMAATEVTHNEYLTSAVAFGFEKLNTYFELILMDPDVSFHAVATALHPGLRLNQFKSQWKRHPQWYNKAEKSIQKVFKQYVADEQEYEDL